MPENTTDPQPNLTTPLAPQDEELINQTPSTAKNWFKGLKEKSLASTAAIFEKGKEKTAQIQDNVKEWASNVDTNALSDTQFYKDKFKQYSEYSIEKITTSFKATFEVDKTTEDIVNGLKEKIPITPTDAADIFDQCKKEALQRAISSFCLAPIIQGLDAHSEQKYANLSLSYQEFKNENNLHDHENFAQKVDQRYEARQTWSSLENAYEHSTPLNPYSADIEHITSKKEIYDSLILRVATTDDELIGIMNDRSNLAFAHESVNRSKGSKDLMVYMQTMGTPVPGEEHLVELEINGQMHIINKTDVQEAYETSKYSLAQKSLDAVSEISMSAVSAGARMAIQQVVGLIVVETIDIMIDEIKDITIQGNFLSSEGLKQSLITRKNTIQTRLTERFEERQILQKAKVLGIESSISGALSIIPQIAISLVTRMPAFVLSMIREGTLSVVRCIRVFLDPCVDKYKSVKVILAGTATAVCGVYISNVISGALRPIPVVNTFNKQITDVISAAFVAALSLSVVYFVDKNKKQLMLAFKRTDT